MYEDEDKFGRFFSGRVSPQDPAFNLHERTEGLRYYCVDQGVWWMVQLGEWVMPTQNPAHITTSI